MKPLKPHSEICQCQQNCGNFYITTNILYYIIQYYLEAPFPKMLSISFLITIPSFNEKGHRFVLELLTLFVVLYK